MGRLSVHETSDQAEESDGYVVSSTMIQCLSVLGKEAKESKWVSLTCDLEREESSPRVGSDLGLEQRHVLLVVEGQGEEGEQVKDQTCRMIHDSVVESAKEASSLTNSPKAH